MPCPLQPHLQPTCLITKAAFCLQARSVRGSQRPFSAALCFSFLVSFPPPKRPCHKHIHSEGTSPSVFAAPNLLPGLLVSAPILAQPDPIGSSLRVGEPQTHVLIGPNGSPGCLSPFYPEARGSEPRCLLKCVQLRTTWHCECPTPSPVSSRAGGQSICLCSRG